MTKGRDDDVGYGRPPESGKIKPGEVRNATGRRGKKKDKEPENFWDAVLEELNAQVPVSVNGKRKKATPTKLGAKQFARRIAEGDPKTIKDLLMHLRHFTKSARPAVDESMFKTPDHLLTMESIVRRIRSFNLPEALSPGGYALTLMDGAGI